MAADVKEALCVFSLCLETTLYNYCGYTAVMVGCYMLRTEQKRAKRHWLWPGFQMRQWIEGKHLLGSLLIIIIIDNANNICHL